jgi:hypothetical protein
MNAGAILLIITLAHGGFWFGEGDSANRVSWEWNLPAAQAPAAEVKWTLFFGTLELDHGTVDVPAGKAGGGMEIRLPEFRVRTALRLHIEVTEIESKKQLQSADVAIQGIPRGGLKDSAGLYKDKKVVVVDRAEGLSKMLKGEGEKALIEHQRVGSISDIDWTTPDVIIVGPEMLPMDGGAGRVGSTTVGGQQELLERARGGASVIILAQKAPGVVAGYGLGLHAVRMPLEMVEAHPLVQGFTRDELQGWAAEAADDGAIAAIQLPANEAAQEVLYWPAEAGVHPPAPLDALIVTRTMGAGMKAGRIVYVQLPMRDWDEDPRVMMLLANLLDYCATRPQPTPAPADRAAASRPTEKRENVLIGEVP